jgi:hypothetical protein
MFMQKTSESGKGTTGAALSRTARIRPSRRSSSSGWPNMKKGAPLMQGARIVAHVADRRI